MGKVSVAVVVNAMEVADFIMNESDELAKMRYRSSVPAAMLPKSSRIMLNC